MKNILLSLAIFFLPLICFGSELSVADSSIVALWHFNEGIGTTTYDSSANKNYGELKNGAVFVTGRTGFYNEINFDGKKFVPLKPVVFFSPHSVTDTHIALFGLALALAVQNVL